MRICFGDRILEGLQIDLTSGLLIGPNADTIASGFLIVQSKMLQIDVNAFGLDALDFSGTDLAANEGILGVILEVAAGVRRAVDVDTGAIETGVALAGTLLVLRKIYGKEE